MKELKPSRCGITIAPNVRRFDDEQAHVTSYILGFVILTNPQGFIANAGFQTAVDVK